MKSKKLTDYLLWLPFAVSIGALILYLRYFIMFKLDSNLVMTDKVKETLNGYLIIVFISLFVGLLIIFCRKIFDLIKSGEKVTNNNKKVENIPEKIVEDTVTVNNSDDDFINAIENSARVLTNVDNESNFMRYVKTNKVIKVKLSEPIMGPSVKGKVVDTDEDIEILLLDDDIVGNNVMDSIKCPKCNKIVNKDAFICTNCGILLNKSALNDIVDFNKEEKIYKKEELEVKTKKFNFGVFAANFLIIILCIFLIFLIGNKIVNQRNENYSNMNVINEIE